MMENEVYLISCKPLKPEFEKLRKLNISTNTFTVGRGLTNTAVIPFLPISRNHCTFRKTENGDWTVEDQSSFGIQVNGNRLGKGVTRNLVHQDVITLDSCQEFVYKFVDPSGDMFQIPRKRIKLEHNVDQDIINDVKLKFEESQSYEIKHIEEKLQSTKQMQTTTTILKNKLQLDMNRKIQQLERDFELQIENLKGEKNEVERQKALLMEDKEVQLAGIREEMEGKISELMNQIQKHNETETELLNENNLLKEKLQKEREEFLSELNRESSSKQDMLEKLESKIREQEEIRLKEKQQLEEMLKRETEALRLAKEKEIKELEEQKKQREQELIQELNNIKQNLEAQVEQSAQQRLKAEQELGEQVEQMKKLSDEDKVKMEILKKERVEIENKLSEAVLNAQKSIEEAQAQVKEREIELAAIAAERIQKEAEQSSEVILSLQEQLEKMRSQLQSVETEKNILLESLGPPDSGEGTSKQTAMAEVGELMENELQCSICAELFIKATTLNCSHTFCIYCITMWKKKKKDCPICRAPITSECKSLVLDSFIEKMVQNLTEDTKKKREELLKSREEEVAAMTRPTQTYSGRKRTTRSTTTTNSANTGSARSATTTAGHIPTVDLTMIPTPPRPRPPPPPQSRASLRQVRLPARATPPIMFDQQRVFQIIQPNGQTVLVVAGPGASPAGLAPTTAATGAASAAARADTGRPAAPSDNNTR
ncbi:E3 ubiquitin-protein ligase RNF8-like isoform X2 [Pectinophora gossypiella]|nr:E3 ubiquitin-protein ligase RNF8-like isoform X2 [Pectinophora gossypiella]